ncbi:MAG: 2Fe-2S iron-sulfur cluster binding domain-containing protein [Alphaproteobacteria bacterium]|nr:2Fe-2S iron-sulfur cluster binding domain-containing protein [Alphaproteobacteria bacterium]
MSDLVELTLNINGEAVGPVEVPAELSLLDFLHDHQNLTGSKFCCGIAVCRACTVAVKRTPESPSVPVRSCTTPAVTLQGQHVRTVEGLGGDSPNALQQSFLDHWAFQCGYCAPGFLMAGTVLQERLEAAPIPEAELDRVIEQAVGDHVCRCSGYVKYHQAIRAALLASKGVQR